MGQLATALAELHRIHRQLADLRERMARGPKQVKVVESNVTLAEQELQQAKDIYRQSKIGADQKQLHLRERETKLLDWQGKMMAAQSNREYQTLKDQIAADEQATSVLSDEILEALEKLDVLQANITKAESNLAAMKVDAANVRERVAKQHQVLEGELARVNGELENAEKVLPLDFRAEFSRISKVRDEDAMAVVEGGCCSGCCQTLTPQTLELLRQDKPLFCKNCGRLMYMTE